MPSLRKRTRVPEARGVRESALIDPRDEIPQPMIENLKKQGDKLEPSDQRDKRRRKAQRAR